MIIGHNKIKEVFLNAFNSGNMHHAWILSGPAGIGKASLGLEFAKFILQHPKTTKLFEVYDPSIIKRIDSGSHPDFLYISDKVKDGEQKKNNIITIDEIRAISNILRFTPVESKYRAVIIDGAESMNIYAANALLKMLEEPPAYTFLFLISHQPSKLLQTILSRCINLKMSELSLSDFEDLFGEKCHDLYELTEGNISLARELYRYPEILQTAINIINSTDIQEYVEKFDFKHWNTLKTVLFKLKLKQLKDTAISGKSITPYLKFMEDISKSFSNSETFNLDKATFLLSRFSK